MDPVQVHIMGGYRFDRSIVSSGTKSQPMGPRRANDDAALRRKEEFEIRNMLLACGVVGDELASAEGVVKEALDDPRITREEFCRLQSEGRAVRNVAAEYISHLV